MHCDRGGAWDPSGETTREARPQFEGTEGNESPAAREGGNGEG